MKAKDVGLLDTPKTVRNLWAQTDGPAFAWELSQRVEPHETVLLKVTQG